MSLHVKGLRGARSTVRPEEAVVAGDFHFGDHDPKAVKLFIYFCKVTQPKKIFLNGDILDCYSLSKYHKTPLKIHQLQEEIELWEEFIKALRSACPHAEIHFMDGNHDVRLKLYAEKQPEITKLKAFSTEVLLDLREYNVSYKPYKEFDVYGDIHIWHGDIASKHSASAYLDRWGVSGIFNHKHNMQFMAKTDLTRTIKVWINGCMCSLNPHYKLAGPANWQQGFCHIKKVGDKCYVNPIHIEDYRFLFENQIFSLRQE